MGTIDELLYGNENTIDNGSTAEQDAFEKEIDYQNQMNMAVQTGMMDKNAQTQEPDIDAPSAKAYIGGSDTLSALSGIAKLMSSTKNIAIDVGKTLFDSDKSMDDVANMLGYSYNKNVAQPLRDDLGVDDGVQNKGAWFQPDFVIDPVSGRKVMTGNKSMNDYTPEELQYVQQEKAKKEGDETYYEMTYNDMIKKGYSKTDVFDRYKNDPNFEKWYITKQQRSGGAKEIERLEHGSINSRANRTSHYTDKRGSQPLVDGRTEIYHDKTSELFDKRGTGTSKTQVQEEASQIASETMDNDQVELQQKVREKSGLLQPKNQKIEQIAAAKKAQSDLANVELTDFWKMAKDSKDGTQLAELLTKRKEALNEGDNPLELSKTVISEDQLNNIPAYQNLAQSIDGDIFKLGGYKATPQEKAANLSKMLSDMNWNMSTLMSKVPQLKGNKQLAGNLADALEAYNATDTDAAQVVRGAKNMALDPTNAIGFVASNVGKLIGKNSAKLGLIDQLKSFAGRTAKAPLKMAANVVKSPTSTAAATGAGFTGIFDAGTQAINIIGGKKDEFSFEENGKAMGMGFAIGGALAKSIGAFTGKANTTPKVTVDEFDTMIAQMTKKAGDHKIDRAERGLYRKEVVRMRKYRDKIAALKDNAEAKANYNKQMKIIEDMKVEIAREARRPNAHPNIAKFYGLEKFEKTKTTTTKVEDADAMNTQDAAIDTKINAEKAKIENPTNAKPKQETEPVEVTKFEDSENLTRETRQPVKDRGEEIIPQSKEDASIPNKQKEIEVETRGASKRGYQVDGYLDGHQQGKTGFSQMKMTNKKPKMNSVNEVDGYIAQRVKNFQEKESMISVYGQNTAKESKRNKKLQYTKEESLARRASYELNEIGRLMVDKKISAEVKASLKQRAKDLIKSTQAIRKPGVLKNNNRLKKAIKDYDDAQYKAGREYDNTTRNKEVSEQYKFLKDAGKKDEKITVGGEKKNNPEWSEFSRRQQFSPYNSIKENGTRRPTTPAEKSKFIKKLYTNMRREQRELSRNVGRLEDRVRKQLLEKGIHDDLSVLPDRGVDMDAVRTIQKYRDLSDDIKAFENKDIKHEELLFRETQRMDDKIDDALKEELKKDGISEQEAMANVVKKYDELGINTKGDISVREDFVASGKPDLEAKKIRENAEKAENEIGYDRQVQKFDAFEKRNYTQKRRTATNRANPGKETVTEKQAEYLAAGVSKEELARLQFPEGATKATINELKKANKKALNTRLNEKRRQSLGIPSSIRFMEQPPKLSFENTMIDASNSMLQMMAILTRSETFGKYSKLTGTKEDVRTTIGDEMSIAYGNTKYD